jgi:hypothetical protein
MCEYRRICDYYLGGEDHFDIDVLQLPPESAPVHILCQADPGCEEFLVRRCTYLLPKMPGWAGMSKNTTQNWNYPRAQQPRVCGHDSAATMGIRRQHRTCRPRRICTSFGTLSVWLLVLK